MKDHSPNLKANQLFISSTIMILRLLYIRGKMRSTMRKNVYSLSVKY